MTIGEESFASEGGMNWTATIFFHARNSSYVTLLPRKSLVLKYHAGGPIFGSVRRGSSFTGWLTSQGQLFPIKKSPRVK